MIRKRYGFTVAWILCSILLSAATEVFGASIDASPTQGVAPLAVSFTAVSSTAVSYQWDFGDGAVSTSANPSHTYVVAGTYNVTLTTTDAANQQEQATAVIVVTGSTTAPVTDNMNFRWAIREANFKLNFTQANTDSLSIESAFSTADLPVDLQGLAVSFKVNGVLLLAGILDSKGIIQSTEGVKPNVFFEIVQKDQTLSVFVSKDDLSAALALSGATNTTIPSPGVDVPVSFTLTIAQNIYTLTENFNYKAQAGKTGRGKFNFKNNTGSINQGFFVITRGSAAERNNGKTHFLEFDGLLALPNERILKLPGTGTFRIRFANSTTTTLLFDTITQKGGKITYEQQDRALSVIKKLTIDPKLRTFSIVTWDVPSNVIEEGTGIPIHDSPVTDFFFELRFDFDQPDGTTFSGVAATLLSRKTTGDTEWKSGPKKK